MERKIAILRGINVGGKRKILMADLKTLCEKIKMKEIKTYIQSGNVIFRSTEDPIVLEKKFENTIREHFGFEVPVIVRTSEEFEKLISKNPFWNPSADIDQLHLTLLKEKPAKEKFEQTKTYAYDPDKFVIKDKNVFLFIEGKYHQSRLTNNFFEKKLNTIATTRNWKTILKLVELSKN